MNRFTTIVVAAAVTAAAVAAQAKDFKLGNLEILAPHAAATRAGQMSGGAFMTIKNNGDTPDYLIGAAGEMAEAVQVHQTRVAASGVATMAEVDKIEIPPHGSVALKHGGYHVMLMGLKAPLKAGSSVPLTLIFQNAGKVKVDVTIDAAMGGMKTGG